MEDHFVQLLEETSERLVKSVTNSFRRYLYNEIDFNSRLIILKGARGVGKTTLLLQFLKASSQKSIYLSLDHLYFTFHPLIQYIDFFYKKSKRIFVLDEVHRYSNWSIEVKNIIDSFPDITLLLTSSSAVKLGIGTADLSRRADIYNLYGLSFREYLELEHGIIIKTRVWENLINENVELDDDLNILHLFQSYLKHGYYPFFKEAKQKYVERLLLVINQVIDVDIPAVFKIDYESTRQIKKLLAVISKISPFSPNILKLSRDLSLSRNSILQYLDFLESAELINTLKANDKSDSVLTKPDKIFLENTNLLFALGDADSNLGNIRETFVVNALKIKHKISTPAQGDILLNGKYTIEIGGPNKNFHQIFRMPNPILIKDGIITGGKGVVPLWTIGLLY